MSATFIPIQGDISSLEDFYETGSGADLVVVASPLQYHADQSCEALQHGSHVLCEKPVAATIQEVDRLMDSRQSCQQCDGSRSSQPLISPG